MTVPQLDVTLDRPMPQSIDAERAVLGALLINNKAFYRIQLSADQFYKDAHGTIYGVIAELMADGREADILTVKEELARRGQLDNVGGYAYITALTDVVPDIANIERYAAIVERMAKKRDLVTLGNRLMRDALDAETEPEPLAGELLTALGRQATREDQQSRRFITVLSDALNAQEDRRTGKMDDVALRSGYAGLDAVRAIKRSFGVIGAPSEAGKTTHLVNLWDGLATNGHPTALFTLESDEHEVALRWASMKTGLGHGAIQDFRLLKDGDFGRLATARSAASRAPMWITRKLRSVEQIYLECQRLKATEGLDCVLIDYIQLVQMKSGPKDREERLAIIAQTLLELALDLRIGVYPASQVRDDWTKRDSGRLVKEDLKYARAIAETARVVCLFHRPRAVDKSNKELKWCDVLYQIEKNSENRTEDPPMHMDEVTQRFTDGDCESNDCRSLRSRGPLQQSLTAV